ncbi:MAG: helix-turn-helix domain-containing protein [Bacteroidales bacterium]
MEPKNNRKKWTPEPEQPVGPVENSTEALDTSLENLMDAQDVCTLLRISKKTLARLRQKGLIVYTRLLGKIFYLRSELEKSLKANLVLRKI